MSERGRIRSTEIAIGSNTTVKATAGTLYGLYAFATQAGSVIRAEQADLGAAPDLNATDSTTTLFRTSGGVSITSNSHTYFDLRPGIGFGKLVVASTSNTRVVALYE